MAKKGNKYAVGANNGAPTKYRVEYNEEAYRLCLLGLPDKKIADYLEVSEATLNNWKLEYPDFLESMKNGKVKADGHVAKGLYERATGSEWIEQVAIKVKRVEFDDQGKKIAEYEEVEVVDLKKADPPDTPAASLWLRNRQSHLWRDKQDHEHSGTIATTALTPEQLAAVLKEIKDGKK